MSRPKRPPTIADMISDNTKALIISAVEYGFRSCEEGYNLDRTLIEARKLLNQTLYADAIKAALGDTIQ